MSTQHTPGPWEMYGPSRVPFTFDQEAHIGPPDAALTGGYQYSGPLAVVAVSDDTGGLANARLIAAAPDLLAALKQIVYWNNQEPGINDEDWAIAREVIAKAEGVAP